MDFLKLYLDRLGGYSYKDASNVEMCNLSLFLASDVNCYNSIFKKWAMADKLDPNSEFWWTLGGNITFLEEKENGFIYLSSKLPLDEDEELIEFKIPKEQFIKLLDDWEQKVCKLKPAHVVIKYENDKFIFQTEQ